MICRRLASSGACRWVDGLVGWWVGGRPSWMDSWTDEKLAGWGMGGPQNTANPRGCARKCARQLWQIPGLERPQPYARGCTRNLNKRGTARRPLTLRARMRRKVFFADMGTIDVRVDLGRRDIGVAKHLLDGSKIGTAFKQMGRKGMAQRMRVKIRNANSASSARHDLVDALPRDTPAARVQKHRAARLPAPTVKRAAPFVKIGRKRV